MAIVSISEHWNGRGASDNREGVREFERAYIVVVDHYDTGPQAILEDSRIPAKYSVYTTDTETDLGVRVIDRQCKQEGEGYWTWMVTCKYSSKWYDQAKADPNPLLRPEVRTWSTKDVQEPFTEDLDGNAVVNAANEAFDPPIMRDKGRLVVTIEKNLPYVDPQQALTFHHAINDSEFLGFPAGQAKVMQINWSEQYEGENVYDKLKLTIEFNEDGWEFLRPMNQGFMETDAAASLDAGEQVTRQILDTGGSQITKPRLLDEDGIQLSLATDDPVFLSFKAYVRRDFSLLGIST